MSDQNNGHCLTGREKYWSEIGIEDKVKRMRDIVKNMQNEIHQLRTRIYDLSEHSHSEGKIVIPMNKNDGCPQGYFPHSSTNDDEVFF